MTYNADKPCLAGSSPLGYIMKVQKQSLEHIFTLPYSSSSQPESSASHQMALKQQQLPENMPRHMRWRSSLISSSTPRKVCWKYGLMRGVQGNITQGSLMHPMSQIGSSMMIISDWRMLVYLYTRQIPWKSGCAQVLCFLAVENFHFFINRAQDSLSATGVRYEF